MKQKLKKKSGLYAYLNSAKVLENGSDQDIALARKKYWSEYRAKWRQQRRKEIKELLTEWNPRELHILTAAARKHNKSRSRFIKACCFSYINNRYIVPDSFAINTIKQYLAMNYNALKKLFDENRIPYQTGSQLMQQISELERSVSIQLENPKTLEQLITEAIQRTPDYKEKLIVFLQNL